jgi:hypothetical protein
LKSNGNGRQRPGQQCQENNLGDVTPHP